MGIVFDIKEFSVHDGPGVRQTVFLKGCPLRCTWCHNPEGQRPEPELLIRRNECTQCHKCTEACTQMTEEEKLGGSIISMACMACGKCMNTCHKYLRTICGEELTARELADRILKNAPEYELMRGGVTFSGGEPLMQGEFLIETMKLLPGMHKAVETCGYADPVLFRKVFDEADLVMCDIKLMDRNLHIKYTGLDNDCILENVEYMKQSGKPFVIRVPLIPGITDTDDNLNAIREFLKNSENLIRTEYLPYNTLAGVKYEWLGRRYSLEQK